MLKLGIAGTAKNTGKTTVATKIISALDSKEVHFGLTSIGYDGEDFDTVTGLPKPKYLLPEHTLVATAQMTLSLGGLKFRKLKDFHDMPTPLGNITLIETLSRGRIPIAGPSTGQDLVKVLDLMKSLDVKIAIVDGAFNRISPFSNIDKIIITTGLSRSKDLNYLVFEASLLAKIFNIRQSRLESYQNIEGAILCVDGDEVKTIVKTPFLNREDINLAKKICESNETIIVNVPIKTKAIIELIKQLNVRKIIFKDPISLILSGDSYELNTFLNYLIGKNIAIEVLKQIKLACIAVNPCGVTYDYGIALYKKECLPPQEVLDFFRSHVKDVPVKDFVYEDPDVFPIIFS